MSQQTEVIRFHNPAAFAGLTGVVDRDNCIIRGVSCITGELEAEGHHLFVDRTTLTQLHSLANGMQKVPVTVNHDGGVQDVDGWLQDFQMDGNQLRADWHLLETHKETPTMLERAERQSSTFGLSFAFNGDPKGVLHMGKRCARAEKIKSCDVVKHAAANPGGLFSSKTNPTRLEAIENLLIKLTSVDSREKFMPNNIASANQPATLDDVVALLTQQNARIDQLHEVQQNLVGLANQSVTGKQEAGEADVDPEFLSALNDATDEELAAYNQKNGTDITRADVNSAVSEYNAGLAANQGEEQGEGEEGDGQFTDSYGDEQGQAQGAASGGGAETGAAGQAFSALQRELVELKRKFNAKEQKEIQFAEQQATADVRGKIALIVGQRDQLVKLSEKLVAENEALRLHVRTGTRPVIAGIDTGIRLFQAGENGELHPWQQRVRQIELSEKVSTAKAMSLADKEDNGAAHEDFIDSQSPRNRRINT